MSGTLFKDQDRNPFKKFNRNPEVAPSPFKQKRDMEENRGESGLFLKQSILPEKEQIVYFQYISQNMLAIAGLSGYIEDMLSSWNA
ncbi:hypothetical protein SDC9_93653 [bioreactor metagenome]|uniref:Uncharacterized protein n=1 Tax=bioreactor metagenome TaxID=1076179 RepID=A0A645A205_9ZZZZ